MKLSTSFVLASVALSQSAVAVPIRDSFSAQELSSTQFTTSMKRNTGDNANVAKRYAPAKRRSTLPNKRQTADATGEVSSILDTLAPLLQKLGLAIAPAAPQLSTAQPEENDVLVNKPNVVGAIHNATSTLNGTAPPVHPPVPANVTEVPGNVTGTTHVAPPDLPAEVTALPASMSALPTPASMPIAPPSAPVKAFQLTPPAAGEAPQANNSQPASNPPTGAAQPLVDGLTGTLPQVQGDTNQIPGNIAQAANGVDDILLANPAASKNATSDAAPSPPSGAPAPVPTLPTPPFIFSGAEGDDEDETEDCSESTESADFATDIVRPNEFPVITQTVNLPSGAHPITMTIIEEAPTTKAGQKHTSQHTKTVTVTVDGDWPYDDDFFAMPTEAPAPAGSIADALIPSMSTPAAPAPVPTDASSGVPSAPSVPVIPGDVTAPVPTPSLPSGLSAPTAPNPTDIPPLLISSLLNNLPPASPSNGIPVPAGAP